MTAQGVSIFRAVRAVILALMVCLIAVGVSGAAGEDSLLSQSWVKMQTASLYKKWTQQNPGESSKLSAYWANGGTAPVLATAYGKALVLEAQAYWSLKSPPPPPPPPPPPTGCPLPAYPDASCTGVPAGTTLTPSGGLTISAAGTVIDARDITGPVVVNAPNVTIRNSRIRGNSFYLVENKSTGLLVEDSEIINQPVSGQNNCHNGIGNSNFTVRRTEITGCENAMNIDSPGNVTFTDNYVHDLDTTGPSYVWGNDPHPDGIQVGEAASNVVLSHNTIDPVGVVTGVGATSAIIMYTSTTGTPNSNVRIEDNYLDGRNAATAVYAPRQSTSNIYINRNKMLKGVYGTYTFCVKVGVTVTEFNSNLDAITGTLIAPDNGVGGGCTN